ncbi:MAG: type II secretion system protein GspM [Pseudomonadota bacterium]
MKDWFAGLQPRERLMVSACAVIVAVTIGYVGIWEPLQTGHQRALEDVERKSELVARARRLAPAAGAGPTNPRTNQPMTVVVANSVNANGLSSAYRTSSQSGPNGLRVALENASFDDMIAWLAVLERENNIVVESSSVTRRPVVGRVDASIVLTQNP